MFVVRHRQFELSDEVNEILQEYVNDGVPSLLFPSERYRFNAVLAIIAEHKGDKIGAKEKARRAIAAYDKKESGFRYHPEEGIVTKPNGVILKWLREMCDA